MYVGRPPELAVKYSYISIYSRHIAFSFCFPLTVIGLRYVPKTTSGFNISTQNDSAGISCKINYRQQTKVQILTLLSCKGLYLVLYTLKNLPQNENVRKMSQQQL